MAAKREGAESTHASGARKWSWLAYPLLLLVVLLAWSWSSPAGSSPDEDFHLINTWCALGPRDGLCAPGSTALTRVVPADLANVSCYAFKPSHSGNCPRATGATFETNRWNYTQLYPDGYYTVMAVFARPSVDEAVLLIRTVNSVIYAAAMAAVLFLANPRRRGGYMLVGIVALVPLGLFTVASVNPSSWAITSSMVVWPSVYEFFRATDRRRRIGLAVLTIAGLALGLAARVDAAAYGALALILAWISTARLDRRALIRIGLVGALLLAGLLALPSVRVVLGGFVGMAGGPGGNVGLWFQRIQELPNIFAGAFGSRGLGWLDTSLRPATWVPAISVYAVILFMGLRSCGRRKGFSLVVIGSLAVGIPLFIAGAKAAETANINFLQPRYFLPLLIMAALVAVVQDNDRLEYSIAQALVVIAALSIAQASALYRNLRRYITGVDEHWFNLDEGIQWWWSWGPSPMAVLAVGSLAFAALAAVVFWLDSRQLPMQEEGFGRRFIQAPSG